MVALKGLDVRLIEKFQVRHALETDLGLRPQY